MELFDCLNDYTGRDYYPFHMPGHKRNPESGLPAGVYQYDITEIEGFDNLHQPETIIRDAQQRAARLYDSEETYFLINGSTAGILSAVSAVVECAGKRGLGGEKEGGIEHRRLIIARNCHKAVYHAAFLNHLNLHYVYPGVYEDYDLAGAIDVNDIESIINRILTEKKAEAKRAGEMIAGVVVTSPTYDGIVSDIKKIAEMVHSYGIPLIVDQAHGAHFGMHPDYPENAVREGADIVIHSVHKTLSAPTQTALLHKNGVLVDSESVRKYLRIYQSSSPSYILMAGIDKAIRVVEKEGCQRLEKIFHLKNDLVKKMEACRYIRICPYTEPGKLVISVKGSFMTGQMLSYILRKKYHLEMEMAAGSYAVAILSMMDKEEGFIRLLAALLEIDKKILKEQGEQGREFEGNREKLNGKGFFSGFDMHPDVNMGIWEAYTSSCIQTELEKADGKVIAEFVHLYPPGIPLLIPGEVINQQMIKLIAYYIKNGYTVQGIQGNKIKVVNQEIIRR